VWDEESYATSIANLERVLGFAPVLDESQRSLSLRDDRQIAWKSKTSLPEHVDIFNCLAFKIKKLTYGSVYDNPPLSLARLDTTDLEELTIHRIKTHLDFSSFRKLKRLCILVPPRFGDHPFRIVADNLCELRLVGLDARAMPELPLWLFEMKHLESLLLKWCHLEGFIPSSVGKLTKLKHLDLSDNNLRGELPAELEQLCLRTLILTNNIHLSGDIKLQSTTSYNFDGTHVRQVGLKDMIAQV
jgi:Leucine-rich repeat (LRR) protein